MSYQGFVIHHSACPSINGKGFDFWVARDGGIHAAPLLTDPESIHICLEGDFGPGGSAGRDGAPPEQMFAAGKLILELSGRYRIPSGAVRSHDGVCPGSFFRGASL
ncbi:N-acetylmuramoyl-L-alanine amidase [Paenibacillus spiritus]|uniref:peptidoglycan recognition protein family protein n=1 Tax=Paenibacillus spiritus TaxID=2496557 RepID=UPI001CC7699A|nr:N-acetylmuramoyl-L-alanine amidase [Paenibacillus spiritus]